MATKKASTNKSAKKPENNEVIFTRFYRYDLTGGGLPFGHNHEDAAELKFQNGKVIWRVRDKAIELGKFVQKNGKPVGKQESLPYGRDYAPNSYQQKYSLPSEFTHQVIEKLIPRKTF